jgi:hypothetical protein
VESVNRPVAAVAIVIAAGEAAASLTRNALSITGNACGVQTATPNKSRPTNFQSTAEVLRICARVGAELAA